jgi:hypothetical protein
VVIRATVHDCLVLPIEPPTAKNTTCKETPAPHVAYGPLIERTKHPMSHDLSVMMVIQDFMSRCITPSQGRALPAWMYIIEGNTTWLECGCDSSLYSDMLGALMPWLSPDPSLANFITPPVMWMLLLRVLPTLDDIDIIVRQRGYESRCIQIHGAVIADGQGSASTGPSSRKEKGKAVPHIILSDIEVTLQEDDAPL